VAADDDGRPSFAEVVKAVSPPGLNWDEWKAAMREAHQTGGHYPGKVAPDISMSPQQAARMMAPQRAGALPFCLACGDRHYDSEPCAGDPRPDPADPFSEADAPSVALAEMYWGMVRAGIPVTSVEGILGRMMAEHGRDDPERPGE